DFHVTGVQTCALPIFVRPGFLRCGIETANRACIVHLLERDLAGTRRDVLSRDPQRTMEPLCLLDPHRGCDPATGVRSVAAANRKIGRASCRERAESER